MASKKERITDKAFELLEATPHGLQYSELVAQLHAAFPEYPHGTITGSIWNLAYSDTFTKVEEFLKELQEQKLLKTCGEL
jgi:hypothetical protein